MRSNLKIEYLTVLRMMLKLTNLIVNLVDKARNMGDFDIGSGYRMVQSQGIPRKQTWIVILLTLILISWKLVMKTLVD